MNDVLVMMGDISSAFFTNHGRPHSVPSIHDKAAAATHQTFATFISVLL
jgi:hypothetical protein